MSRPPPCSSSSQRTNSTGQMTGESGLTLTEHLQHSELWAGALHIVPQQLNQVDFQNVLRSLPPPHHLLCNKPWSRPSLLLPQSLPAAPLRGLPNFTLPHLLPHQFLVYPNGILMAPSLDTLSEMAPHPRHFLLPCPD